MFRIVVLNDPHFSDQQPPSRKDDYTETCFNKFQQVLTICNQYHNENDDGILIITGDIFHSRNPIKVSHKLISRLIKMISDSKVKVYAIPGNHDLSSYGGEIDRMPYHVLESAGAIETLTDAGVWLGSKSSRTYIEGVPFCAEMETDIEQYKMKNRPLTAKNAIKVVHGNLLNTGKTYFGNYFNVDKITEDNEADLILCGHLHMGIEPETKNNTKVLNYGSMTRLTSHETDLIRTVYCVVLEMDNGKIDHYPIPLKVKDKFEVFDVTQLKADKKQNESINMLIDMLSKSKVTMETDFVNEFEELCIKYNIDIPVIAKAKEYLLSQDGKQDGPL